jgi:uncharacterized C2H2 Zn-finger protein
MTVVRNCAPIVQAKFNEYDHGWNVFTAFSGEDNVTGRAILRRGEDVLIRCPICGEHLMRIRWHDGKFTVVPTSAEPCVQLLTENLNKLGWPDKPEYEQRLDAGGEVLKRCPACKKLLEREHVWKIHKTNGRFVVATAEPQDIARAINSN